MCTQITLDRNIKSILNWDKIKNTLMISIAISKSHENIISLLM